MEELVELVYPELRRLARSCLGSEGRNKSLRTTELINEAYIRMVEQRPGRMENRAHFFGVACRLMRQILVDHARKRNAWKRGAGEPHVELDEGAVIAPGKWDEILVVNAALDELSTIDPRQARIVEMKFYGGLSTEETAVALGISTATVKREWRLARAWLFREFGGRSADVLEDGELS